MKNTILGIANKNVNTQYNTRLLQKLLLTDFNDAAQEGIYCHMSPVVLVKIEFKNDINTEVNNF